MIELTKEQKEALPYIKWLFHGPRATGRTVVICAAAVEVAMEVPYQRIDVVDHNKTSRCYEYTILNTLEDIISSYPEDFRNRFKIYKAYGIQISYEPVSSKPFVSFNPFV